MLCLCQSLGSLQKLALTYKGVFDKQNRVFFNAPPTSKEVMVVVNDGGEIITFDSSRD